MLTTNCLVTNMVREQHIRRKEWKGQMQSWVFVGYNLACLFWQVLNRLHLNLRRPDRLNWVISELDKILYEVPRKLRFWTIISLGLVIPGLHLHFQKVILLLMATHQMTIGETMTFPHIMRKIFISFSITFQEESLI